MTLRWAAQLSWKEFSPVSSRGRKTTSAEPGRRAAQSLGLSRPVLKNHSLNTSCGLRISKAFQRVLQGSPGQVSLPFSDTGSTAKHCTVFNKSHRSKGQRSQLEELVWALWHVRTN